MTKSHVLAILACVAALGSISAARPRAPEPVAYPDGFRRWSHVHSALVGPGGMRPGLYHIYANEPAMRGYASGKFPEGSVIAFDLYDVAVSADKHTTTQAARKLVDVMVKDSTRFAESGGWGFAEFIGEGRVRKEGIQKQCAQCHATRADKDYVFSSYKE